MQISHSYSQHSSYDHWVLSLEIVRHADGEHFHRDDLATTPAARNAVHIWVSCNEELSQLVHEFARRGTTTLHEAGVVGVRGDQLWPTSRRETRCAQMVVRGKVTVELRDASDCFSGGEPTNALRTSIQVSHSIGRMPIVTLLFYVIDNGAK